ncbi:unnamed protein product [Spirodela intermedia]|uniref:Uncharacterized protein n=1 Tax=Spirodela intermedia TaxID=51605 RepID=A0A7I8JJJ3_SPIIN|nr:unnamed protein product [Spirodela intermedia]CAA6670336.1 unnamed protein product [Spirodela intermedia]
MLWWRVAAADPGEPLPDQKKNGGRVGGGGGGENHTLGDRRPSPWTPGSRAAAAAVAPCAAAGRSRGGCW